MTIQRRTQALLDLVEDDRSVQCETILAEARKRASALLAQAHADVRARMREAIAEERQRAHERVAAAQATLQTRRRLHVQRRATEMLALGWQRLPDALIARWNDAPSRQSWVDAIVAMAQRTLPRTSWRIAHGPDWPMPEQKQISIRIAAALETAPILVAQSDIPAGLKISAGGNVVDGTLAGLVDDHAEVGALLLRHLEQTP